MVGDGSRGEWRMFEEVCAELTPCILCQVVFLPDDGFMRAKTCCKS
jgi:hypothetical protein